MFKKSVVAVMALTFLFVIGCSTHIHEVGSGASGSNETAERQWYILFGLVPLNNVDSNTIAAGASDYTVQTQANFLDIVIGIFTGIVTIHCRTVTVTK